MHFTDSRSYFYIWLNIYNKFTNRKIPLWKPAWLSQTMNLLENLLELWPTNSTIYNLYSSSLNNEGVVFGTSESFDTAQLVDEQLGVILLFGEAFDFVSWAHGFDFVQEQ